MENKIKNQLKALAIYQVAGGILGIGLLVWVLFSGSVPVTIQTLRISLFGTALFVFSILCGRMLFWNARRGLILSLVNQLLQVVYFAFGSYGFLYVAGVRIGLGLDLVGSWTFKFRLAISSFEVYFNTDTGQKLIGVNLVALALIFWIESLLQKVKA